MSAFLQKDEGARVTCDHVMISNTMSHAINTISVGIVTINDLR